MANLINVWKGKKKKLIFANMSSRGFDCLRWIFKNTFYRKKVAFFVGVVTYTFIQRRYGTTLRYFTRYFPKMCCLGYKCRLLSSYLFTVKPRRER